MSVNAANTLSSASIARDASASIDMNIQANRLTELERLVLDVAERRILGVDMPPLLTGELKLLSYLGTHAGAWHSSYALSVSVYGRDDAAGRQLVWKYVSTLRRKLAKDVGGLIELCRRRGYKCRAPIAVADSSRASVR